jgi:hypothetical protein
LAVLDQPNRAASAQENAMTDSTVPAIRLSGNEISQDGLALPPLLTTLLRQAATEPADRAQSSALAADWLGLVAEGKKP